MPMMSLGWATVVGHSFSEGVVGFETRPPRKERDYSDLGFLISCPRPNFNEYLFPNLFIFCFYFNFARL